MPTKSASDSLISVVITCYNYGQFLPATLDSVKSQSHQKWECIIVDDGSTDNTKEIILNYSAADSRFRYIYQENKGSTAAKITALDNLSPNSVYYQFLDADDLIEERKFEIHGHFLDTHLDVDFVYGDARYFHTSRPEQLSFSIPADRSIPAAEGFGIEWIRDFCAGDGDAIKFFIRTCFPGSCPLFRLSVFTKVGFLDKSLKISADWDFFFRCVLRGLRFHYLDGDRTRTLIRYHPGSLTTNLLPGKVEIIKVHTIAAPSLEGTPYAALNGQFILDAEAYMGIEWLKNGHALKGSLRLLRVALFSYGVSVKLKWLCCLFASPFVDLETFRLLPGKPIRKWLWSNSQERGSVG